MRHKEFNQKTKRLDTNGDQIPDWYWKGGLHDAQVLSITESLLPIDWKSKDPLRNCLEIGLSCRYAMFERNITKIKLFNYKLSLPLPVLSYDSVWWISDAISMNANGLCHLEIELVSGRKNKIFLKIDFESAEIERKQ